MLGSGATFSEISKTQVESFEICLPSLSEQKHIAAILNEQLAAIECARAAAQTQLETAQQLPSVYLRAVFDSPDAQKWPKKRLKDIAEKIGDGTHQPPPFENEGIPFLFVRNIVNGYLDFNVSKYVSQQTYDALTARFRPMRDDVLYSAVGSFGVAVPVDTDRPFTFQRHIAHIRPGRKLIDPRFLAYFLNSSQGRRQSEARALGGAQRTVTLTSLANFEIPVPTLGEQKNIVAMLSDQLDAAKRTETTIRCAGAR
jgi:type I restriction enzyme S subunit